MENVALNSDILKAQLRALMNQMLTLPRHPRGFQGPVEPDDVVLVARFRDPATGAYFEADPGEMEPGTEHGQETPEADLFLRESVTVGTRRPTSLVDVLARTALPIVEREVASKGGWLAVLKTIKDLFIRK